MSLSNSIHDASRSKSEGAKTKENQRYNDSDDNESESFAFWENKWRIDHFNSNTCSDLIPNLIIKFYILHPGVWYGVIVRDSRDFCCPCYVAGVHHPQGKPCGARPLYKNPRCEKFLDLICVDNNLILWNSRDFVCARSVTGWRGANLYLSLIAEPPEM